MCAFFSAHHIYTIFFEKHAHIYGLAKKHEHIFAKYIYIYFQEENEIYFSWKGKPHTNTHTRAHVYKFLSE